MAYAHEHVSWLDQRQRRCTCRGTLNKYRGIFQSKVKEQLALAPHLPHPFPRQFVRVLSEKVVQDPIGTGTSKACFAIPAVESWVAASGIPVVLQGFRIIADNALLAPTGPGAILDTAAFGVWQFQKDASERMR
jgi:hypothetical protein